MAVNGTSVRARAALREALPPGSVFLIEGTSQDNANALTNGEYAPHGGGAQAVNFVLAAVDTSRTPTSGGSCRS